MVRTRPVLVGVVAVALLDVAVSLASNLASSVMPSAVQSRAWVAWPILGMLFLIFVALVLALAWREKLSPVAVLSGILRDFVPGPWTQGPIPVDEQREPSAEQVESAHPEPSPVRFTQTADQVDIAYRTVGDGAVLLLPPSSFPFSNVDLEWRNDDFCGWYQRLADTRRVVRYDARGFGLSVNDKEHQFTLDELVLDLEAVAERLGPVALFAAFHAGPVAIEFARRHPQRVSRLILWCSYANAADFWTDAARTLNALIHEDWNAYTQAVAALSVGPAAGEKTAEFAAFLRSTCRDPAAAERALQATQTFDVSGSLGQVSVPTLVLHRRNFRWLSDSVATKLANKIPNADLRLLDGESGLAFVGDIDEVVREIDAFLNQP